MEINGITITIKNKWEELTIGEFNQILQISKANVPEEYKMINLVAVLTNQPEEVIRKLPVNIFTRLATQTAFLKTKPPKATLKPTYELNGRTLVLQAELTRLTTAQYIDYQQYVKETPANPFKIFSVFLVPEGHEYGEGYNMEELQQELENLPLPDAREISFFMQRQSAAFILLFRDCLSKRMKKMKISKKKRTQILQPYSNMGFYLWSSK